MSQAFDFESLVELCQRTHEETRHSAVRAIDCSLVTRNWLFGWYIVEYEQHGADRAEYGVALIKRLAAKLAIRGCSSRSLALSCKFYRCYSEILQTVSAKLMRAAQDETLSNSGAASALQLADAEMPGIVQTLSVTLASRFSLGWSHYVTLLTIDNADVRHFYEIEAAQNQWSVRELGKGFLFEARQKRFTFDNSHFRVDLVFYNRLLRCYVLIDLKRGELTHQDLGQMQMYVNYFDRYVKTDDELPTIGIVLCGRKNDAVVELTLPQDANIYASKYQLYLPSKQELVAQLESIQRELHYRDGEDGE